MAQASETSENRDVLFQDIVHSLKLLPEMLRRVFVRSHYQGKRPDQIARELGIPTESVRAMLRDANQIFYRNLHDFSCSQ